MYCRKCGYEIPNDGKFCPKCGCSTKNYKLGIVEKSSTYEGIGRKKTAIVVAAIACFLIVCAVCAITHFHNQAKYDEMVGNAALYIESGEAETAIGWLEKAIKQKPMDVQNYIDIADIYGELKEFESAVEILEQGYKETKNEELAEEAEYYIAIINANTASASSLWDETITHLNTAIEIKPDVVDNYLELATAYVEQWDLFHASEILKQGYNATQDITLKHVSIWGPLSPVEIALYAIESMPVIRCEYVFTENGINSYIYSAGLPSLGAKYICEDEQVRYVSMLDYSYSDLGGIFPQQVPFFPIGRVLICYDLTYDNEGRISAVTYDDQVFVTLEYADGNCTAIRAQTDYRNIFFIGDFISFAYDNQNRISQINYECHNVGQTISFSYDDVNGGFAASASQYGDLFRFDENGMLIAMNDNFSIITDDGHITLIEDDGFYYRLYYSDGNLSEIVESAKEQVAHISHKYHYELINGIKYLSKITKHNETEEMVRMTLSYDERGNIQSIDTKEETIAFTYSDDGTLYSFSIVSDSIRTYVLEYDESGRMIGWNEV